MERIAKLKEQTALLILRKKKCCRHSPFFASDMFSSLSLDYFPSVWANTLRPIVCSSYLMHVFMLHAYHMRQRADRSADCFYFLIAFNWNVHVWLNIIPFAIWCKSPVPGAFCIACDDNVAQELRPIFLSSVFTIPIVCCCRLINQHMVLLLQHGAAMP